MAARREIIEFPPELAENELWLLLGDQESGTLDFKEQLPKPAKVQEPLVAFINHRGGAVVVGVSKTRPHRVIGTRWGQDDDERVQEAVRSAQPPIEVTTHEVMVGGHHVVVLQVEALVRGWVQTSDGRVLVRSGPTNRALIGLELLRFLRERDADPVEDDIVRGLRVADLDTKIVKRYLSARLPNRRSAASNLRDLGWTDQDGRVRLAADLVFGKKPQHRNRRFGIEVLRFEGQIDGPSRLRDRTELEGPIPTIVETADRMIYEQVRRDSVVRGLVREEVPEFPPVAVREALVNSVAHRDYAARGSSVQVRLYDDGLEIESPGTLPGYVTVERLRESQYSRNERVMDGLQRLGFVEEAGQGIDRMYHEMEDALLDPPEFEERDSSFVVRLRGTSVFAAEDRLWAAQFVALGLSADAKVAIVYARRHGAIKNEDLRTLRGLDRDASRATLQDLVARGLLESVGRGRGARYVLGTVAQRATAAVSLDHQLSVVLSFARRKGSIVNSDVRGLVDVDRIRAREILYELVAQGYLEAVGERRGRRYLPIGERNATPTSGDPVPLFDANQ